MPQFQTVRRPLLAWIRNVAARLPMPPGLLFLRQFFSHPRAIGAVIPTSRAAVRSMLLPVDWETCRTFVEYGPGTGVFTREILRHARPDARVIAIDPNPYFMEFLDRTIPDPRLELAQGSAADVEKILEARGLSGADYILSGLPFSTLPVGVDQAIVAATARALQPGGTFLVYQYSLLVKPLLDQHFDDVTTGWEWLCIPPARLMFARKNNNP
jgi:phospholipid N-methyltransferase